MSQWLVRLKGAKADLEFLASQVCASTCLVSKENGDEYYLQSSRFDSLTDATTVRQHGEELIQILNGVAKLRSSGARSVSFGGDVMQVKDDGKRVISVFPPPLTVRTSMTISIAHDSSPQTPTTAETWMSEAEQDPDVARALRLFGQEHTWHNLYKVLEIVKIVWGGTSAIVSKGWATNAQITRFTRTANSVGAVGDAARHGGDKFEPPADPMTLKEASELLSTLLSRLLQAKGCSSQE
jgi:hypothetical protein